ARARVQRAPRVDSPALEPARPILGARPLAPGIQLAATTSRVSASPRGSSPDADPAPPAAGGVRIHRGPEASDLAGELDARAFTHGGDIYLPASHGPLSGQKAQSLLAHEMTHVSQQRRFGSSLPAEESTLGQQLEAQAVAAEHGELPLASPPERRQDGPPPESVGPLTSPIDNVPATSIATNSTAAPQRAPQAQFKDPDDAFRAQLDSNEEYLFGHFERRLRRQLISERERGGTLIDAL
ncbi:MAG TPA: DUF4157 domain-containing protein, partial [Candidatus Limnocylindrales bacterium]